MIKLQFQIQLKNINKCCTFGGSTVISAGFITQGRGLIIILSFSTLFENFFQKPQHFPSAILSAATKKEEEKTENLSQHTSSLQQAMLHR